MIIGMMEVELEGALNAITNQLSWIVILFRDTFKTDTIPSLKYDDNNSSRPLGVGAFKGTSIIDEA